MLSRVSRVLVPALLFAGAVVADPTDAPVELKIDQPNFKDPNAGRSGEALLDINIETACVSNLQVTVHLPTTYDPIGDEATAILTGNSFAPRTIIGTSLHPVPGHITTAKVAWNLATSTLTFSDFIAGGATAAVDGQTGWINLNFDIAGATFCDPDVPGCTADLTKVPLKLVALPDKPADENLKINLSARRHFTASAVTQRCGDSGTHGDPVFAGFQGQQFQFHGLPDEHFNLVSSPNVQLNSHFVYLSSGKCDYNDTECFTHPGTYMDVLGFSVAETHVKIVAGTHDAGLRVWMNDAELHRGAHVRALSTNTTASLKYHHNGRIEIQTDVMGFEIVNSDMFVNMKASLNSQELLRVGATKHTVTDKNICKTNSETHHHQLVESTVAKKYPVTSQLHGLIGQTWRNVKVCGHDWMGTVQDYLVSDLFSSDNHYNYFKW